MTASIGMWVAPLGYRFLQTDPVGYEDDLNLYAYVGSDPVNATDPTGLQRGYGASTVQVYGGRDTEVQEPAEGSESIWQGVIRSGQQHYAQAPEQSIGVVGGNMQRFAATWEQMLGAMGFGADEAFLGGGIGAGSRGDWTGVAIAGILVALPGPPISLQKQARHIPGTTQYLNRLRGGVPTSAFFGERSGNWLTRHAWANGSPVAGRPGVREFEYGRAVGFGPNGGAQTRVRVHRDQAGRIHGHPSGPERY